MLELYMHPLASFCWKVLVALYENYADQVVPIEPPRTRAYLDRLLVRPSMIRVRREAEPYWHMFPGRRT